MTHQFHLPDTSAPPVQPAPPAQPARREELYPAAIGGLGVVMMIAGAFMPWARLITPFGDVSVLGVDGAAGGIALILAGSLGALFAINWAISWVWLRAIQLIVAGLALAYSAMKLVDAAGRVERAQSEIARVELGSGLMLLLVGALIALMAAAWHLFLRPTPLGG